MNTEINVLAGDAIFIKVTISGEDGKITASWTELSSHIGALVKNPESFRGYVSNGDPQKK